jgi:hypothetical protein
MSVYGDPDGVLVAVGSSPAQVSNGRVAVLFDTFPGFLQSHNTNSRIVTQSRLGLLHPASFPVQSSQTSSHNTFQSASLMQTLFKSDAVCT